MQEARLRVGGGRPLSPNPLQVLEVERQLSSPRMPVVRLRGRLDAASVPAFRIELRELLKAGATNLVLDLSELSMIDSSGLGAIIGGIRLARQAGGDLRIALPSRQVRTTLELTSLDRVLRPYGSIDEALADFQPEAVDITLRMHDPTSQLDAVHEALQRFMEQLTRPPAAEWRTMFELAVSEIAANIIEHARPPTIHFRVAAHSRVVVAEFTDSGRGWRSHPGPVAEIDEHVERGRGLRLAQTAVDELAYERLGNTNRWRLMKTL